MSKEVKKIAIVFVDGNNFYHNTKNILDVTKIDFKKLAKFICDNYDFKLKEIRYYNSIPDISENELIYYKHMEFLGDLKKQQIKVFTRKLQKTPTKEILKKKKEEIQNLDFCETCESLVKEMCSECVGNSQKKEKGIDVKIASDMIRKCLIENLCDICILISGDADFIPAMQTIKESKKETITASVYQGYSRELREGNFRYFYLKKENLNKKCLKDYKLIKSKQKKK